MKSDPDRVQSNHRGSRKPQKAPEQNTRALAAWDAFWSALDGSETADRPSLLPRALEFGVEWADKHPAPPFITRKQAADIKRLLELTLDDTERDAVFQAVGIDVIRD